MRYRILKQMVMKYLDPKADLTFKKIFGNHPKRLISLLNALLPLSEEEQIHEIKECDWSSDVCSSDLISQGKLCICILECLVVDGCLLEKLGYERLVLV